MYRKIAFVVAAVLCVSLGLGMAGCGSKGDPEQTVKGFWDALQRGDFAAAESYLAAEVSRGVMESLVDPSNDKAPLIIQAILNSFQLDILGSSVNGDKATVDVEMTMPDRGKMSGGLMDSIHQSLSENGASLSEEEYMQELMSALTASLKKYPSTIEKDTVSLVWESDEWKIDEPLWHSRLQELRQWYNDLNEM